MAASPHSANARESDDAGASPKVCIPPLGAVISPLLRGRFQSVDSIRCSSVRHG